MNNTKPWYQSKTLYINALVIFLGILQVVAQHIVVDPEYLAIGTGIANFLLRFVTTTAIIPKV
jgi:hypothetical protein